MCFAPRWTIPLSLVAALAAGAAGAADRCGNADLSGLVSRIYVSPAGTDSDTCGTSSSTPCQSIQHGIDRCGGAGCGVLVRYGLYTITEAIRLKDAVNVYGRCVLGNEADHKYRSVVEAPPDGKPAITAASINSPTLLDGVFVKGSDATSPGAASIAMTISESSGLTITNSTLSSGKGADGASGRPGATGGQGGGGQGPQGSYGGGGGGACGGGPAGNGGGAADVNQVTLAGCLEYCQCSNTGFGNGGQGQTGSSSGPAAGGAGGGRGSAGCACDGGGGPFADAGDGPAGNPGQPGACAAVGGATNADIWGGFSGTNWMPTSGSQGGAGAVGAGGGGGGSGGYGSDVYIDHATPKHGRAGGGGGGGGCGGEGGVGGQQGGASIVIVLFKSAATIITGDVLVPGPGGRGGPGGAGGIGGAGGPGHVGTIGPKDQVHSDLHVCEKSAPGNGGTGGAGGQGGAGGGGAGGNGGPSVGTAFVSSDYTFSRFIYNVQPGIRGLGVAGGQNVPDQCQGAKGADGVNGGGDNKWHHWLYLSASASSSYTGNPPGYAVDGDPNTVWNSGGGPPAWIELDLNQTVTLANVRLLVGQSPPGPTTHQLYFGPSPAPTALIATLSGNTKDMQWLEVDAPTGSLTGNPWPTGRYLRVLTTASPSWVAWREIVVQTQ